MFIMEAYKTICLPLCVSQSLRESEEGGRGSEKSNGNLRAQHEMNFVKHFYLYLTCKIYDFQRRYNSSTYVIIRV